MRLAITGKKRSGKTTLARALQEDGWVMMSFADPIKNLAVEMCDVALSRLQRYHELVGQDGRNLRMSRAVIDENKDAFRPFLQWLGTEFGRDFLGNEEIWNWHMEDVLDRYPRSQPIVIDDCRFPNEAQWAKEEGFVILRIIRPDNEDCEDMHPSEQAMEEITPHATIYNSDTIETLIAHAKEKIEAWEDFEAVVAARGESRAQLG